MFVERVEVQGDSTLYRLNNLLCRVHNDYHRFAPVKEVLLPVPFVPQQGAGADLSPNDCGPACSLMLLRAYGKASGVTVDRLTRDMGAESGRYTTIAENVRAMQKHGLQTASTNALNVSGLLTFLSSGKPVIALVNYQHIVPFGRRFAHFVVVTGCHVACDSLFFTVHDPLQDRSHTVSSDNMLRALSDPVKNLPYQGVVPNEALTPQQT